ncbi:hypothetical protein BU24DRAFT_417868 [Aaosphaeria arxii CBS 175.79]|uniref:Uncharacterized protein n=1 Tax=Aaosphaeria arxii CBS 175.79 TaxID=1450172 RepID=A0A6A5YCC5_9PLEO|nr:uncharacterized protein BU24DRAFT_417868 [Aaosphaeria arxii CBS 175.79]KAF2022231.1 hypothetical protein BU24DRAFT_417868 [Aaosphaeria arxii CBS 175.79]
MPKGSIEEEVYQMIPKDSTNATKDAAHETCSEVSQLHNTPGRQRSFSILLKEWKWELSTWAFGTLAFAALVVQVVWFRDRPTSEWRSSVSISALIAALSQVTQSTLLVSTSACIGQLKWIWLRSRRSMIDMERFDNASRGPNGSFWFLLTISWRYRPFLASLGAFMTILLLAFATFAQQVVTIDIKKVHDPFGSADIPYAMNFTSYSTAILQNPGESGSSDSQMFERSNTTAALLQALYLDSQSLSDVPAICTGSFCEWAPYKNFGLCAQTTDISSSLKAGTVSSNLTDHEGPTAHFVISGHNISLPDFTTENEFWAGSNFDMDFNTDSTWDLSIYNVFYCDSDTDDCPTPPYDNWGDNFADPSKWKVFKSTLSPCLQTLSTTVNGTTNTSVVESRTDLTYTSFEDNYFRCFSSPDDKSPQQTNCLGQVEMYYFVSFLVDHYNINNYTTTLSEVAGSRQYVAILAADVLGCDKVDPSCKFKQGAARGVKGLQRRMENFGIAFTNVMRRNREARVAYGSVSTDQQYFNVDLKWLILPLVTYVSITFLLFSTIYQSRKGEYPLWKWSSLAALHVRDEKNTMNRIDGVVEEAKSTTAQLEYSGKNWVLRNRSR